MLLFLYDVNTFSESCCTQSNTKKTGQEDMTQPLSRHRHISFTAHYTGYIWYQMGISNPIFATSKGKFLAKLVHPLETWAERHVGGSMRSTLKQRHRMIDEHLYQLLAQHPKLQVLEIACGLSPRGWNFRQKFRNLVYRELDLPEMARVKTQALQQLDPNSPTVLSADIFSAEFAQVFQQFDPNSPLVVISEGLINYFDQPLLSQLFKAIHQYGQSFPEIHYLSDLYPEPVKNKLAHIIWSSSKLLKFMSRSAFSFHFTRPSEAQQFLRHAGFENVHVLQPQLYFQVENSQTSSEEHLGDLVWMLHAYSKSQSSS